MINESNTLYINFAVAVYSYIFVNVILVLVKICLIYAAVCPRLLSTGDFKFIIRVNLIIFLVTLQLKIKRQCCACVCSFM